MSTILSGEAILIILKGIVDQIWCLETMQALLFMQMFPTSSNMRRRPMPDVEVVRIPLF